MALAQDYTDDAAARWFLSQRGSRREEAPFGFRALSLKQSLLHDAAATFPVARPRGTAHFRRPYEPAERNPVDGEDRVACASGAASSSNRSEIYGGINGFWDYGPLGAELKRNLRDTWWRAMTREREDVVGLDATIIMHPAIWKASGHVDTFAIR